MPSRTVYIISAYNGPGVVHRFINTTDVVAAIEDILGLERLSQFDYFSRSLHEVFAKVPDLRPFVAEHPRISLTEKNPPKTAAATISEKLDFSAPDRVDDAVLNKLLWTMLKRSVPEPLARSTSTLHALQLSR